LTAHFAGIVPGNGVYLVHVTVILRTLIQMVAAELGITLMPQIAVDSELASTRNVVIRTLSPDKPFRTLVLAWPGGRPPRAAPNSGCSEILSESV
jgi:DNA-binding transcriptional LysR family regulator